MVKKITRSQVTRAVTTVLEWSRQNPDDMDQEDREHLGVQGARMLITALGEDLSRPGVVKTPLRMFRGLQELCSPYKYTPTTFQNGEDGIRYSNMVLVRNVWFASLCEHHVLPFFGTVTIGYVPDEKVLGLSKLARIARAESKGLQVQERITDRIADKIMEVSEPRGVGVLVKARHLCMEIRGVHAPGTDTVTSAIRGVFEGQTVREEFLRLAGEV